MADLDLEDSLFPNILVGLDSPDDAGVYKLSDDLAIVQTIDFFTPIIDSPYDFGQIAVANALSDIYAMGATPITAMNIACFPIKKIDKSILKEILRGGIYKLDEAGVPLIGGHTVDDVELKYGLSVTGTIHPDKILSKAGAKPGDVMILTKPIGTGIITTAMTSDIASVDINPVVKSMITLNKTAAEVMTAFDKVHACTDITGFGLLGHIVEMMKCSNVGIVIESTNMPIFPNTLHYAESGLIPGGTHANRKYFEKHIDFADTITRPMQDVLFDAQTSGGLLICVDKTMADRLLQALHKNEVNDSAIIGYITSDEGKIKVI